MSARLYPLRRMAPSDFKATAGHTDGIVTQPAALPLMDSAEGLARIDTSQPLCRHRAQTDEEAEAAYQRRKANTDRLADDAISRRQLAIWAVVFVLAIAASAAWPAPWGYGWQP